MADQLGKAVLELSTDSAKLDKGLGEVPPKVKKTAESAGDAAGQFTKLNGLLAQFGAGLSIGAVVAFGKSLLDAGDAIVKVSDRTGLTTDEVQRLQYVAEQSGNSLDDLTGAVSKLQVRLADGTARKGIEELGLNFEKIRNMDPGAALSEIADAISKIENPTLRAQRAVQVFGKASAEILPTLTSHFKALHDEAPVMADATVRALDEAGDSLNRFGHQAKVWAAEAYNFIGKGFDRMIATLYRGIAETIEGIAKLAGMAAKIPGASKLGIDSKLTESLKAQSVWYLDAAKGLETYTVAATAAAPAVKALPPLVRELTAAQKEHAKALADLIAKLSGADAVAAAANLVEALRKLPPIANLTRQAQEEIAKTMEAAIDVYRAAGKAIPAAWIQIANAATVASSTLNLEAEGLSKVLEHYKAIVLAIPLVPIPSITVKTGFADLDFAKLGEQITKFEPPKINLFTKLFGSAADLGAQLGAAIQGAIQGGGNVLNAAGGVLGQKLGSSIAAKLALQFGKEGAGALSKALGGMLSAVLPGIGALIGPLMGKLWSGIKGLFTNAGHDAAKEFAGTFSGGFDEILQKLEAIGREDLWKRLTQSKDPKAVQAAIEEITAALAKQAEQVKATGDAAEQAAKDMAAAQQAELEAISAKYADAVKAIDQEYKTLSDRVSAEQEEAIMGVQETQDRARMAELEKQRAALEQQAAEELAAKEATFAGVLDAGAAVDAELRKIFGESLKIPYEFVPTNAPGLPPSTGMAAGGFGRVTAPTLFYSAGNEDFAFSGEGRSFGLGGLASRPIVIQNVTTLDGRVVARNQVRHVPNELARVGIAQARG